MFATKYAAHYMSFFSVKNNDECNLSFKQRVILNQFFFANHLLYIHAYDFQTILIRVDGFLIVAGLLTFQNTEEKMNRKYLKRTLVSFCLIFIN